MDVDLHRQGLWLQAEALAGGAGLGGHVAGNFLPRPFAVGFEIAALQIADHALEGLAHVIGAQPVVIGKADGVLAGAEENGVAGLFGQIGPEGAQGELEVLAQGFQGLVVIGRGRFRPGRDGALAQRRLRIGDHQLRIDLLLGAQPATGGAGAEGIVEGEEPWLHLGDREAGHRAGEFRGEDDALGLALGILLVGVFHDGDAVGQLQRGFEGFRQPGADIGAHHDAVHHHVDVVLELLVEHRRVGDLVVFPIDLQALEAALQEVGDFLAIFALAATDHRGEQEEARALWQGQHPIHHLAHGLALDGQAGGGGIGDAHPRP